MLALRALHSSTDAELVALRIGHRGLRLGPLVDQVAPTTGVLTPAGESRCVLTTGSDSLNAMTYHLLALGVDFTVLEPAELIDHLRDVAGRLARAVEPTR